MQAKVLEAVKYGKKRNNRISVFFIGQDRVGKTSVKKSLLGEELDEQEPSTVGIDFDVVEVKKDEATNSWRPTKEKRLIASEEYTSRAIGNDAARRINEDSKQVEDEEEESPQDDDEEESEQGEDDDEESAQDDEEEESEQGDDEYEESAQDDEEESEQGDDEYEESAQDDEEESEQGESKQDEEKDREQVEDEMEAEIIRGEKFSVCYLSRKVFPYNIF